MPKKLPQRREVDHKIELEPGAKPPARAPPELEELRKQLRELLGAEYMKQSKASQSLYLWRGIRRPGVISEEA